MKHRIGFTFDTFPSPSLSLSFYLCSLNCAAMKATSSSSSSAASSSVHLEPLAGSSSTSITTTTTAATNTKPRLPKVSFAPLDVAAPSAAT